jgi:type II secretory pathway component PulJ
LAKQVTKLNKLMKTKYKNINQTTTAGFGLVEVLTSMVITGILSVLISYAWNFMLSSNQKIEKEETRRIEMSRAMEAITTDIRMSQQVNKTAASTTTQLASAAITDSGTSNAFSPVLNIGTPVLYLEIPMVTGSADVDRVIYHVKPKESSDPWLGPQVLYRYGRVAGINGDIDPTSVAQDVAIADGIVSRPAPTCTSPAISSGLTTASENTGFYACVNNDQVAISIFGGLNGTKFYEAKGTITARAIK